MRTKEQIENLRKVLITMYGPYAMFMSEEDINRYADRLQKHIDDIEYNWEVKVRVYGDDKPWEEMEAEPTSPRKILPDMQSHARQLLKKYPAIKSLYIKEKELGLDIYVFEKEVP